MNACKRNVAGNGWLNGSMVCRTGFLRRAAIAAMRGALILTLLSAFLIAAAAQPAQAQTYSVLYSFCSQPKCADGANPYAGLVQDKTGALYGTTNAGGSYSACWQYGCGTVFKLAQDGTETVLHSFTGTPDGAAPYAGLVLDGKSNILEKSFDLYGTTVGGGAYDRGMVFEVTSSGTEKVL